MGNAAALPDYDMSLPRLRLWLERALALVDGERVVLVGSSWGGALSLEFAAQSPMADRVEKMVLLAPVHPGFEPGRRQRFLLTPPWTRYGAAWLRRAPRFAQAHFLSAMFGDPARIPGDSLSVYRAGLDRSDLGRVMAGYARHWRRDLSELAQTLANIRIPSLVLWGDRDRAVPVASAAALQRLLPGAEFRVLPGVGHLPYEEAAADFHRAVLGFLTP